MTERRVVLVLSGGGVKTAAHLGAWRAAVEAGLRPTHVVAVSMGAALAAVLGAGVAPDDLFRRLVQLGRDGLVSEPQAAAAGLLAPSLFDPEQFRRAMAAALPARRFADLDFPLTVPVVDLDTSELVLYGAAGRDAPLLDVVCATCALPLYFPPVMLDGRRCGDGGLRGVLPLEPAAALDADLVLAVDVGPGDDQPADGEPKDAPALLRAHDDAMRALMAAGTTAQLALWRADPRRPKLVYVRPPVERNVTFRIDRAAHYVAAGYQATRDALDSAP